MESKYEQLTKLKDLLDAGSLTQEEFDAAKERILENEDTTPQSATHMDDTSTESMPSRKNRLWIIIGIAAAILIVGVIVALTGNKNDSDQYDVPFEVSATTEEDETAALQEAISGLDYEPVDGLTIGNPWRQDFLHDEWGENDINSPFIYTTLDGSGWDIHIDFIAPTSESKWGIFRFYLVDDDGRLTSSSGPVNIFVKGSNGETNSIEVTGTRDGITFVENPSEIETLKYYLNEESFDIQMEFDKYNERHRTQARWEACKDSFEEAKNKFL